MSTNTTISRPELLSDAFLAGYPDFPPHMNELGLFVFMRTYSRYIPEKKRRETYKEVCNRATQYNVNLSLEHLKSIGYTPDLSSMKAEAELLFDNMFNLRQFLSGRTMWIGGTKAAEKTKCGNFNCSFLNITKWEDLGDLFYMLLVGTGVGFKCTKKMTDNIPKIRANTKLLHSEYRPLPMVQRIENTDFHVFKNGYAKIFIGDSKEGWVNALRIYFLLLTDPEYSHIHTIKISYNSVRPHGERLKTFGGQASGPQPLREMFQGIDDVLKNRIDTSLAPINTDENGYGRIRPIHILDIGNLIGNNVVVGGVRRCLPAGSMVHARSGLIPIEEIKVGEEVMTSQGYRRVTDWFDQGERDLIKIVTQDGDFTCTENHRMPVLTSFGTYEWVEAGKLKPGQRLITSRAAIEGKDTRLPPLSDDYGNGLEVPDLDEDMAWFLGLFTSGGCVAPDNDGIGEYVSVCLASRDGIIADKVADQMNRFGGFLTVSVGQVSEYEGMVMVNCKSKEFARYIDSITNNRVPSFITSAKNSVRLAYIAGVLVGNGSVFEFPIAVVSTIYEDFARDVQKLLYSCGIESRLSSQSNLVLKRAELKTIHSVRLVTKRSVRMVNAIPELHKDIRQTPACHDANSFPVEFCSGWKESFKQKIDYEGSLVKGKGLNVDYYDELMEESQFCPVKVLRLEPCGKGSTYDITVDGPNESKGVHEFYVNGYLSHNTAEIFLFDSDDYEVLFAKYGINGFWTPEQVAHHKKTGELLSKLGIKPSWFDSLGEIGKMREGINHRRMSNNSIAFTSKPSPDFMELVFLIMRAEGEPGFINLETANKRRPHCEGLNPCSEILLDSYGLCNLTTVNLVQFVKDGPNGKYLDLESLIAAQRLSARCGLRMTLITLELKHWDSIQKRDRLLGTSLTGVKDAIDMLGYDREKENELISLLGKTAREEADLYAKKLRVNCPLLVTTVKPEGSLSQVAGGVSSGLHLNHSPFYIRRIRINAADPLAKAVKEMGWNINPEVGTPGKDHEERMKNARTWVIDFPVASGAKRTKNDTDVREQFDTYFSYQKLYTEHNSSNTITVRPEEWDTARELVYEGWNDFVGVSFLQLDGGTYALAPYEACDEKTYLELKEKMRPFDMTLLVKNEQEHEDFTVGKVAGFCSKTEEEVEEEVDSVEVKTDETMSSECVGGVCPLR